MDFQIPRIVSEEGDDHRDRGEHRDHAALELAVGEIDGKVRAGMTGIRTNKLLTDPRARRECTRKIAAMAEAYELPVAPHDVPLWGIVTERGFYRCGGR